MTSSSQNDAAPATAFAAAFAKARGEEPAVSEASSEHEGNGRPMVAPVRRSPMPRTRRELPRSSSGTTGRREVDVLHLVVDVAAIGAEVVRDEVLAWVHGRCGGELSVAARSHEDAIVGEGDIVADVVRRRDDDGDAWSLRLTEPGRTTEVSVVDREGASPRVTYRTSSDEDADASAPDVVRRLAHRFRLSAGGRGATLEALRIIDDEGTERLGDVLTDPHRTWPVFVLSIPFEDGATDPLVDADALAAATCGMAQTFVLPAEYTWTLSRRFGKERSVHSGAVRTYMPGFDEDDDVYAHPLTLPAKLATPAMRAGLTSRSVATAAAMVLSDLRMNRDLVPHAKIAARVDAAKPSMGSDEALRFGLPPSFVPLLTGKSPPDIDVPAGPGAPVLAVPGPTPSELAVALSDALRDVRAAQAEIDVLRSERDVLETELATARADAAAATLDAITAGSHVAHLREALRNRGAAEWEVATPPAQWDEVAPWVSTHLRGMVTLAPLARRNLCSAAFEDVALVHRCLLWLAGRAAGGTCGTLLDAVIEPGVRVRPCGDDAFDFDDGTGSRRTADWHVKAGGDTRDPRHRLRIYLAWDAASRTFVVADMPGHRDGLAD